MDLLLKIGHAIPDGTTDFVKGEAVKGSKFVPEVHLSTRAGTLEVDETTLDIKTDLKPYEGKLFFLIDRATGKVIKSDKIIFEAEAKQEAKNAASGN